MLGSWDIKISKNMPEKVATAVGKLADTLIGAEYTPILYLGSQVVNGTNHAVLAEQLITTGKDTKNVVVIIFNEKGMDCTLVNIERVVLGGGELGGVAINTTTDIPEDVKAAFETAKEGFVGANVEPVALLGTQVTKGTDYIFAAKVTPVVKEPSVKVGLVIANDMTGKFSITDLLSSKQEVLCGYAFTWLK